ncbi:MAG: imidazole glycerol phosphate synthase subunit HisH [Dehalococcoidia bacterium]
MPGARIAIINTRAANLHSVSKALEKVGANAAVTSDPVELAAADAAVLPGVGASDAALRALKTQGLTATVRDFAASGRPLLCVCLGMQILFDRSEEGELPGLGIMPGEVKLFPPDLADAQGHRLKVPHMGWNSVQFTGEISERHPAFADIPQDTHFYFVHSYHCVPANSSDTAATADYGVQVCAAVVRDNVVGTQFHPEKSGDMGLAIYSNFTRHAAAAAAR